MLDLQFDLVGTVIPADNALLLAAELQRLLPWLTADAGIGIQHLKGAETNSGDASININRRTKLFVRVPKTRVDDMLQLLAKCPARTAYEPAGNVEYCNTEVF